jgi:hypothetical protein
MGFLSIIGLIVLGCLKDLTLNQSQELSEPRAHEVSFVFKFLAVVSLLLFFAPIVGLVLASVTVLGTFKSRTWPRTVGFLSLILSSLVSGAFVILQILGKFSSSQ